MSAAELKHGQVPRGIEGVDLLIELVPPRPTRPPSR